MASTTMQLEFQQAMSDFKIMFPDMDREVIEAVLRANQGAVDATIDQLLAMSTDNQNEKLRNELDGALSPQRSLINLHDSDAVDGGATAASKQQLPVTCSTSTYTSNAAASSSKRNGAAAVVALGAATASPSRQHAISTRWNPPILGALPAGFLRITLPGHEAARDFELPDEQFALMLQNEEFMNQLRWNQEFMNALEKEQCGKARAEDDADFKERLKNMGKMSRKKFLQMARVFTWQRNKKVTTTSKQIDSLPLKEEPSDDEHEQQKGGK